MRKKNVFLLLISLLAITIFILDRFEWDLRFETEDSKAKPLRFKVDIGSFTIPLQPLEHRKLILKFDAWYQNSDKSTVAKEFTPMDIERIRQNIHREFEDINAKGFSLEEMNDEEQDNFFIRMKRVIKNEVEKEINSSESLIENVTIDISAGTHTESIY